MYISEVEMNTNCMTLPVQELEVWSYLTQQIPREEENEGRTFTRLEGHFQIILSQVPYASFSQQHLQLSEHLSKFLMYGNLFKIFLILYLILLQSYFCFLFWFSFGPRAYGIFTPWPGIKPAPLHWKVKS